LRAAILGSESDVDEFDDRYSATLGEKASLNTNIPRHPCLTWVIRIALTARQSVPVYPD
jgi:hypothetical protein